VVYPGTQGATRTRIQRKKATNAFNVRMFDQEECSHAAYQATGGMALPRPSVRRHGKHSWNDRDAHGHWINVATKHSVKCTYTTMYNSMTSTRLDIARLCTHMACA
jgi:hypothetical protein